MTEPYLFEKTIGQQMGDLCRLAMGEGRVTQTGDIVTLEDMPGRGNMGVSVEVPYTSGGVQRLVLNRCGKNLMPNMANRQMSTGGALTNYYPVPFYVNSMARNNIYDSQIPCNIGDNFLEFTSTRDWFGVGVSVNVPASTLICISSKSFSRGYLSTSYFDRGANYLTAHIYEGKNQSCVATTVTNATLALIMYLVRSESGSQTRVENIQVELGSTATAYEPYNGDTYTITLPASFYGGSIDLTTGTVTSIYAADGSLLAEPVVTEIDPISISILAGVNNIWADVGTVTVSYYAADAQTFRPALWYPTIYRGLTSARYLIKRASGAIASFDDAVAAPLVGLRVALPWRSEGWQSVSVTVNGTLTTITLPTTIYGGYLDVVTGQLVATHDENGNLLANQKLYFLPPTNINALAGVNNVWSDAGDVAVSYRIDNG